MTKTPDEIRDALRDRLFGHRVIQNNFRGELVEEIIASAIEPSWKHCSEDWASWDFRRGRQLVQVKQAAARQSWDKDGEPQPKRKPAFSIAPNSGYYVGPKWESISPPERIAQIYIFAWHDDASASADHFDFSRWIFFVVPTVVLNEFDGRDSQEKVRAKGAISVADLDEAIIQGRAKRVKIDGLLAALDAVSASCSSTTLNLPD